MLLALGLSHKTLLIDPSEVLVPSIERAMLKKRTYYTSLDTHPPPTPRSNLVMCVFIMNGISHE